MNHDWSNIIEDNNKVYTDFTKLTLILRSGKELVVKFPTEEIDDIILVLSETMKNGICGGNIIVPEYNGINPKNMMIRLSSIDVVQF